MPLYEYHILTAAGETVATLTLPVPVAERDALRLERRTVPHSIALAGGAEAPGHAVLRAYQRLEQKHGNNREFRRRIGHSPDAVKRAWSQP